MHFLSVSSFGNFCAYLNSVISFNPLSMCARTTYSIKVFYVYRKDVAVLEDNFNFLVESFLFYYCYLFFLLLFLWFI